ncbi:MAG: glycoside hydrolase family 38 C-terminal domain-containing protein, partial [Planctomycetota bacterium]|nr:glycoside hydrolase family 38 C-terminal domain-containing protein [Planctomycetota bacterium]
VLDPLVMHGVEDYEPDLFARIQRLVRDGRWHIMGGWYLQPDCNMPGGESFVRQILLGRRYFRDKFGVEPTTAMNLDSFGHTRGLVQILARSGYDSYLYCRPKPHETNLPGDAVTWIGFDGSRITAVCASVHYNSPPGGARRKIEDWLAGRELQPCMIAPWGVGNHGGGPSRRDLADLAGLMRDRPDLDIRHSTPEAFFGNLHSIDTPLPEHDRDLNPWAVGCYTSMMRVKRDHRALENDLFMAEKMASTAALQGLMPYPRADLHDAACDLAAAQFHDALAGTSIEPVERAVLRSLGHGLTITSRIRARAFFALSAGQREARAGEFPILVFNPHPYPVRAIVECELQPHWPHRTRGSLQPIVSRDGRNIAAQAERPYCNINEDHRKRIVFDALLRPGRMNRFDCRLDLAPRPPRRKVRVRDNAIRLKTADLELVISMRTGLIDRYRVHGVDCLKPGACRLLLLEDDADPWGMKVTRFRNVLERSRLMSKRDAARLAGHDNDSLPAVRVIEDGPVRTVIEAMLRVSSSFASYRYKVPKSGGEMELEARICWNETDRMLKLSFPTLLASSSCLGQTAFGACELPANGDEAVAHKWAAVLSTNGTHAFTCINDATYGLDMNRGELRISLLRAPAHAGHPVDGDPITCPDRYTPRIDQGHHIFRFWLNAGPASSRLARVDREALAKAEAPMVLSFSPSGAGRLPAPGVALSDRTVQVSAIKYAEDNDDLIIRLYEPSGRKRTTTVSVPSAYANITVTLTPFEIKTLRWERDAARFIEVDLPERAIR